MWVWGGEVGLCPMVTFKLHSMMCLSHVSAQAQSFPVDESDLQSFLQRGAVAVTPLIELLYMKAFSTYHSIFEPSVSNFDKRFRVQNATRLLK